MIQKKIEQDDPIIDILLFHNFYFWQIYYFTTLSYIKIVLLTKFLNIIQKV